MNTEQALDWFRNAIAESRKFKESIEDKKDKSALEQQQLANAGGLERQGLANKGQMGLQELQGSQQLVQKRLADELARPVAEASIAEGLARAKYYTAGAEKTQVDAANDNWIMQNIPDESKKKAYYLRNPGAEPINTTPFMPEVPAVGTQAYDPVTLAPTEIRYAIPKQTTPGLTTQNVATPESFAQVTTPQPGDSMFKYIDENGIAHFTNKKRQGSEIYIPRARF